MSSKKFKSGLIGLLNTWKDQHIKLIFEPVSLDKLATLTKDKLYAERCYTKCQDHYYYVGPYFSESTPRLFYLWLPNVKQFCGIWPKEPWYTGPLYSIHNMPDNLSIACLLWHKNPMGLELYEFLNKIQESDVY